MRTISVDAALLLCRMSLRVKNSDKMCRVDDEYVHWFADRELYLDAEGVFFNEDDKKFYVHDEVMTIACKEGKKEPLPNRNQMRRFVKIRCSPRVQEFFFGRSRV